MPDIWRLYSQKVISHFSNPRNVGVIENPDGIGYVGDPSWGIDMELYIKVENSIIVDDISRIIVRGDPLLLTPNRCGLEVETLEAASLAQTPTR